MDDYYNQNYYDFYSVILFSIYYYYYKNYYFLFLNFIISVFILLIRTKYIYLIIYFSCNYLKKINNLIKIFFLESNKYLSRNYDDKKFKNKIDSKEDLINKKNDLINKKDNLINKKKYRYLNKIKKFYKKKFYYDGELLHMNKKCNNNNKSIIYFSRKVEKYFEKNNLLCNKCKFYKEKKKTMYISNNNIIHSCKKCEYNDNKDFINIYDDEEYDFIKKTYIFCDYCLLLKDKTIKI